VAGLCTRIVALAFLAGIALSYPLWFGPRSLPYVPLTRWFELPALFQDIGAALLCIALVRLAIVPGGRRALLAPVLCSALLVIADILRAQPWVYMYCSLLSILALSLPDRKHQPLISLSASLACCRIVLAAMYIYAGLHKLNPYFAPDVLAFLMSPLSELAPAAFNKALPILAIALPIMESLAGVCLLVPRLRRLGVIGALFMHGVLLLLLSPLGINWNVVVWPWNLALMALIWLLFWPVTAAADTAAPAQPEAMARRGRHALAATVVLFMVLPALSFWNLWPGYFSYALYCGNTCKGYLEFADSTSKNLPAAARELAKGKAWESSQLSIFSWTLKELRVPPFPEPGYLVSLSRKLNSSLPAGQSLSLLLMPRPLPGQERQTIRCSERLTDSRRATDAAGTSADQ
jgi:uncharacterized membrane protein YphA (DoxX/SURF4 family)